MIGALYPRLHLTLGASFTDLSDRLRSRNLCDGAIMQTIAYKRLRTNATGINCNLRTMENIHAEFSGWATNRASSCINVALSYGLKVLTNQGVIDQLMVQNFAEVPCADGTSGASPRDASVTPMTFMSFAGLFVLWGVVSSVVLAWTYLPFPRACRRALTCPQVLPPGGDAPAATELTDKVNPDSEGQMLREVLRRLDKQQSQLDALTDLHASRSRVEA